TVLPTLVTNPGPGLRAPRATGSGVSARGRTTNQGSASASPVSPGQTQGPPHRPQQRKDPHRQRPGIAVSAARTDGWYRGKAGAEVGPPRRLAARPPEGPPRLGC